MKHEIDRLVSEIRRLEQAAPLADEQLRGMFERLGLDQRTVAVEIRGILADMAETLPTANDRAYARQQLYELG